MDHRKSAIAGASDRTLTRSVSKIRIFPGCSHHEIASMALCPHLTEYPPSTFTIVPVTKVEASEARKIAAPAISSGFPNRPAGAA